MTETTAEEKRVRFETNNCGCEEESLVGGKTAVEKRTVQLEAGSAGRERKACLLGKRSVSKAQVTRAGSGSELDLWLFPSPALRVGLDVPLRFASTSERKVPGALCTVRGRPTMPMFVLSMMFSR